MAPAYGQMAELLPDGTRLIRRTVLPAASEQDLAHDLDLLARVEASRSAARAVNVSVRAGVVVGGLVLAALVIAEAVPLPLAGLAAVALLFAPEFLRRFDESLRLSHDAELQGLRGLHAFTQHAGALISALSPQQRLGRYESVLREGEAPLGGPYSARLVRGTHTPHALLTVLAAA